MVKSKKLLIKYFEVYNLKENVLNKTEDMEKITTRGYHSRWFDNNKTCALADGSGVKGGKVSYAKNFCS